LREVWVGALVAASYAQQEAAPGSPARTAWIGGHGTEP